jgi:hypothetical protein
VIIVELYAKSLLGKSLMSECVEKSHIAALTTVVAVYCRICDSKQQGDSRHTFLMLCLRPNFDQVRD